MSTPYSENDDRAYPRFQPTLSPVIEQPPICNDRNCTYPYNDTCKGRRHSFGLVPAKETRREELGRKLSSQAFDLLLDDISNPTDEPSRPESSRPKRSRPEHDRRTLRSAPIMRLQSVPPRVNFGYASPTDGDMMDSWLGECVEHTVTAKLEGREEVGFDLANERNAPKDLQDPPCPLCGYIVGPPLDQHLLRCIYAHEEMVRLNEMVARKR